MNLPKDISELLEAGVITSETAQRIQTYFDVKRQESTNRLYVVFGVLGAILIGLGIMLIIAHNWDELSRTFKTIIAFVPLLSGHILAGYVLLRKHESTPWIESSTAFLIFAVGACISLVSQIYHIPGSLSSFMLMWALLCLPLVYVMKSSIASLLYIVAITYFAGETGYWAYPSIDSSLYWLLITGILPYYYLLWKHKPQSNFTIFHHWMMPLSIVFALGTIADARAELMFIAYFSLFGLLYLIGETIYFRGQKYINNGYKIIGLLGMLVLLLTLSFDWFWQDLRRTDLQLGDILLSPEFVASVITSLLAAVLLYWNQKNRSWNEMAPLSPLFILFIATFIIGIYSAVALVLINIYLLLIGVLKIKEGAKKDHLGIMNFGLLIITAQIVCRFFDMDLSFVVRGALFVLVGVTFIVVNYWMLKKRKLDEK